VFFILNYGYNVKIYVAITDNKSNRQSDLSEGISYKFRKKNYEAYFLSKARKIYDIITRKFGAYSPHVIPLENSNGNNNKRS
jgi:hypothetical protein